MYGISYIFLRSTATSTRPSPRRHGDCTSFGLPDPEQAKPGGVLGASWPAARRTRELGLAERGRWVRTAHGNGRAIGTGARHRTAAPARGGSGDRRRAVVAAAVVGPPAADVRPRRPPAAAPGTSGRCVARTLKHGR